MAYVLTDEDRALAKQMSGQILSNADKSPQQPKQQPNGLTNFLANAAPIVGGTLGAVGGSFLAPVAGTAVGGAAGAGLGNIIKQKLLGQDFNPGEFAADTAFGALPGAGKLLKGAVGGVKAIETGGDFLQGAKGAGNVAKAATEGGAPSSLLQRTGQRLTESGSGLKAEPTAGGISKLDQQSQFMSKYTGTPRQQRVAMEKDMGNLSGQVDNILAKNPTPISGTDVRTQVQSAVNDPLKYADVDLSLPGVQRNLESHLTKFEETKTAQELNNYIKQLNPIAKRAQDKIARGAAVTDKEAAALTAKRAGDEVLSSIPEIKPLKQNMAQIFEVTPQVAKAGEKSIGLPMGTGLNTKAPVQAAKGIQSKLGALLQGGSKKVDPQSLATAFRPSNLIKPAIKQTVAQSLGGTLTAPPAPEQPSADVQASPTDLTSPATDQSQIDPNNPWSDPQAVQDAYTRAISAGDTKAADTILQGFKAFGQTTAMKPGYTKPTAQQYGLAQAGISSLGQLEQMLGSNPSLVTKGSIPGQQLPVVGGLVSNAIGTGEYNSLSNNVLDALARVRTGAAMTSQEESFYRNLLPKAGDNDATIKSKMNSLKQAFTPFLGYGGSDSGVDLSSLTGQ